LLGANSPSIEPNPESGRARIRIATILAAGPNAALHNSTTFIAVEDCLMAALMKPSRKMKLPSLATDSHQPGDNGQFKSL
jgi:hypothetical protein